MLYEMMTNLCMKRRQIAVAHLPLTALLSLSIIHVICAFAIPSDEKIEGGTTTPRILPLSFQEVSTGACSRDVVGETSKSAGDNGYRLKVVGLLNGQYTPDHVYTVVLGGTYPGQRLVGFWLVAVPRYASDESTQIGTFQHFDQGATMFDRHCPHLVTNASISALSAVELLWIAPRHGTGCLEFRATVIAGEQVWFKDDGALTLTLCEEEKHEDEKLTLRKLQKHLELGTDKSINNVLNIGNQQLTESSSSSRTKRDDLLASLHSDHMPTHRRGVQSVNRGVSHQPSCCACGIAKYQLIFESLWAGFQHSDFPNRLRHWSSTVGASHSDRYSIWRYGDYASRGVQELCELGHLQALERELRLRGDDVRTILKVPAIWWSEDLQLQQSRWTHFSADQHNHLLTTLTRLGPSPDWCVGVSALDLCLPNCTWVDNLSIDLFPWDAGTNDGLTFLSPHVRSIPPKMITQTTNHLPGYSSVESQKFTNPIAVLHIVRIPGKPDNNVKCGDVDSDSSFQDVSQQESDNSQEIINLINSPSQSVPTAENRLREPLYSNSDDRKTKQLQNTTASNHSSCRVSEWSFWSRCSVTCGTGISMRKRTLLSGKRITCSHMMFIESHECQAKLSNCPLPPIDDCEVTEWSSWSSCSTSCGKGIRERKRHYVVTGHISICNRVMDEKEACDQDTIDCIKHMAAKNFTAICRQPADSGPCRNNELHWYYNVQLGVCLPFTYGGCLGNENRFQTDMECLEICKAALPAIVDKALPDETAVIDDELTANEQSNPKVQSKANQKDAESVLSKRTTSKIPLVVESTLSSKKSPPKMKSDSYKPLEASTSMPAHPNLETEKEVQENVETDLTETDCQLSDWSRWSACSSTCGSSFKFRRRSIIRSPSPGGKACSSALKMKRQCHVPPCSTTPGCHMTEWSEWTRCTGSCGSDSVQERVRRPLKKVSEIDQQSCELIVERRYCTLPPCKRTKPNRQPSNKKSSYYTSIV